MQKKAYLRRLPPTEPRYTKFQIAMRYFPDDNFATASRKLRFWIHSDRDLLEALRKTGYLPLQRHFTEQQLKIITTFIGEPI